MTRYSDLEIADHSIMIEGLPKDISREMLEEKLLALFKSLSRGLEDKQNNHFSIEAIETPVINVSVISDYKECLQLTNLLKLAAGKF
tara:strand:+ start:805 stop:1065 length:261 start_codon:yes stop_codon:yes gene_type:complete